MWNAVSRHGHVNLTEIEVTTQNTSAPMKLDAPIRESVVTSVDVYLELAPAAWKEALKAKRHTDVRDLLRKLMPDKEVVLDLRRPGGL